MPYEPVPYAVHFEDGPLAGRFGYFIDLGRYGLHYFDTPTRPGYVIRHLYRVRRGTERPDDFYNGHISEARYVSSLPEERYDPPPDNPMPPRKGFEEWAPTKAQPAPPRIPIHRRPENILTEEGRITLDAARDEFHVELFYVMARTSTWRVQIRPVASTPPPLIAEHPDLTTAVEIAVRKAKAKWRT